MTITCDDLAQFLSVIGGLSIRGHGFKADAGTFTITLTGAY